MTFRSTRRVQLSPFVCQVLGQVLGGSARQPLFAAAAVTALAHESAHASGIVAENRAECRAIRTEPRAAQLLGVSKPLAVRFQHIYRGTLYPYEASPYRTPPCPAGLPGVVVPDVLGTPVNLRPLIRTATAVARVLPRWRDIGGRFSVFALSPCDPIANREQELARFSETLLGPDGEQVAYVGVAVHTEREFADALTRYHALPRCDLERRRRFVRLYHSGGTLSLSQIPSPTAPLSQQVRAFREIQTAHGERSVMDSIYVFDRAERRISLIFVYARLPGPTVSLERRAVEAVLKTSQ